MHLRAAAVFLVIVLAGCNSRVMSEIMVESPDAVVRSSPTQPISARPTSIPPTATPVLPTLVHVVVKGESVAEIAENYSVNVLAIIRTNDLLPPYELEAGQRLAVPGGVEPPAPTPIPLTATPTPGGRQAPIAFGQEYIFDSESRRYSIAVSSVLLNAWVTVKEAGIFNEEPPAEHEYVLVEFFLRYLAGPEDEPFHTSSGQHRLYAANRLWGAPSLSIPPEPSFANQDLFPGAELTGWLAGKYLPVEHMDEVVLVYDGIYFELR